MSIVTVLAAFGIALLVAAALAPDGDAPSRHERDPVSEPSVFACRLGVLTPQERTRHRDFRARLERGTVGVTEDGDGYTFHYSDDVAPADVIAWIEMERRCCPFLRFTLDVPEEGGPSRLRIWGVPGVKAFLASEMRVATS